MSPFISKKLKTAVLLLLLISARQTLAAPSSSELIRDFYEPSYAALFQKCSFSEGGEIIQIRSFQTRSKTYGIKNYALVVDEVSLLTRVVLQASLSQCRPQLAPRTFQELSNLPSNYMNALTKVSYENINALKNAGATHEYNTRNNVYLTVDLCPSHRPMDVELFQKIQGGVKPVPLVISISGHWLLRHSSDLEKLKQMDASGYIKITWVNHSFSHPYDPQLPLDHNFILEKNVDLKNEVFKNEILLLSNGLVPSVFFRFPGLVSDPVDIEQIRQWGLIPLGANAWLALGEKLAVGSFILVHGNGNEPQGLKLLYEDMIKNPELKNQFSEIYEAFYQ